MPAMPGRTLLAVFSTAVAAVTTSAVSAAPQASCSTTFAIAGAQYIVIGKRTACADALPIARALVAAPTMRYVRRGGARIAVLQPPRVGWTCASSTPIRSLGAGCQKGDQSVIYVKLA
jgi:hypothetical protein